ncbi:MAG: PTS sugar transporter subunit IIA [Deltaproteobacteria bacterium]|jgi:PTS system nitrogen regulatory IIA component|nr:PTS sugar transporter subunit IIA [Deltaproteobacteria bacterium]
MSLGDYLLRENILADFSARNKEEALASLVGQACLNCPGLDKPKALEVLRQRETLGSTGIGDGLAIPHGKVEGCPRIVVILARSRAGCDFNSVDGRECRILCLLLAPPEAAGTYLNVLGRFARIFRSEELKESFMAAASAKDIWNMLETAWNEHA